MKKDKFIELDVDFIGSNEPLTLEEKQNITSYILEQKMRSELVNNKNIKPSFKRRTTSKPVISEN